MGRPVGRSSGARTACISTSTGRPPPREQAGPQSVTIGVPSHTTARLLTETIGAACRCGQSARSGWSDHSQPKRANTTRAAQVMVFLHGGCLTEGGASPLDAGGIDGSVLAAEQNIVVVTVDYRLGPLGFLALEQIEQRSGATGGANGVRDCIAALRFVQAHIADFGGDPTAVTVAGQSAGSIIASVLVMAAAASGLFHRAVLESGVVTSAVGGPVSCTLKLIRVSAKGRERQQIGGAGDVAGLDGLSARGRAVSRGRHLADAGRGGSGRPAAAPSDGERIAGYPGAAPLSSTPFASQFSAHLCAG